MRSTPDALQVDELADSVESYLDTDGDLVDDATAAHPESDEWPAAAEVRIPSQPGPASDGPASDGPASDGPASDGPASDGSAGHQPFVPAQGRLAGGELTERERQVLAFEQRWWRHAGAKEQGIRDTFGLSATRYYQILNNLLDNPAAVASDPVLVGRLRRLRSVQVRARRR